jgi:hypothetical protein
VRDAGAAAWEGDRFMAPDIEIVAELVRSGAVARAVQETQRS